MAGGDRACLLLANQLHAEGPTEKLITNNGQHTGWRFDQCGAEDIRFTRKNDTLYAVAFGWSQTGNWLVKRIWILGGKLVEWSLGADGLRIEAPATQSGKYTYISN